MESEGRATHLHVMAPIVRTPTVVTSHEANIGSTDLLGTNVWNTQLQSKFATKLP